MRKLLFCCLSIVAMLLASVLAATAPGVVMASSTVHTNSILSQDDGTPANPDPFTQEDLRLLSGNVLRPNGMFWHDGFLYIGCNGDFTIYRVDDTTGATITYATGVENVNELYVEDGPILWVPDYSRDTLTIIDRAQSTNSRRDLLDGLSSPWGIASVGNNDFLMTLFRNDELIRTTRDGDVEVLATGFRSPTGVVVDDTIVYVANHESARRSIEWFDLNDVGNEPLTDDDMQQLVQGVQFTTNLVLADDGMLYFAYALGTRGVVGRVDPVACRENGGCSNIDVEPVVWTELQAPLVGLNITPDMRLFIHAQYGAEIYWLQLPQDGAVARAES